MKWYKKSLGELFIDSSNMTDTYKIVEWRVKNFEDNWVMNRLQKELTYFSKFPFFNKTLLFKNTYFQLSCFIESANDKEMFRVKVLLAHLSELIKTCRHISVVKYYIVHICSIGGQSLLAFSWNGLIPLQAASAVVEVHSPPWWI